MPTSRHVDVDAVKAAALEEFLNMSNKGKSNNTVFTEDTNPLEVEVISTGVPTLDAALGVGGLPRGRIVELYGPEHSGKCEVGHTLVQTNWGLLTLNEVFTKAGVDPVDAVDTSDVMHLGLQVINERGQLEPVSQLTRNGVRQVFKLKTDSGKYVENTGNHPVRVMDTSGVVTWKNTENVQVGDVLLGVLAGAGDVPKDAINEYEALMLGYLIGDGSFCNSNVDFAQKDPEALNDFINIVNKIKPDAKPYVKPGIRVIYTNNFNSWLIETYNLKKVRSPKKYIPEVVRESGSSVQKAFLSSLFESDGGVEGSIIKLHTSSKQLAHEVQVMLASLGMHASVTIKKVKDYPDNDYYTVSLGGGSSVKFMKEVGFRSQRRAKQAENISAKAIDDSYDEIQSVPYQHSLAIALTKAVGGDRKSDKITYDLGRTSIGPGRKQMSCSRARMQKLVDWAKNKGVNSAAQPLLQHFEDLLSRPPTYEQVVSIELLDPEPTFDLVVPGSHSFVANGLVVHNTSLAFSVCAEAINNGDIVGFVDAEHAMNFEHARWMGVDTKYMMVNQPDSGEDGLQVAENMAKSVSPAVIVIDSVAALTPRSMIEGEIGDASIGKMAKMMSEALGRLSKVASQQNTTFIFINQIREKPGQLFGNPETTPGGRALKFYASVRLEVRAPAGEQIKEGVGINQVFIGQVCNVTVKKNKVAPPFKKASYKLMYEQGVDTAASLAEAALKTEIWTKTGNSYVDALTGENIARGREAAEAVLREDEELYYTVAEKVYKKLRITPSERKAEEARIAAAEKDVVEPEDTDQTFG